MANSRDASPDMGGWTREIFHRSDLVGVSVLDAGFSEPQLTPGFEGNGLAAIRDLQRRDCWKHFRRMAFVPTDPKRLGREPQPENRDAGLRPGRDTDHVGCSYQQSVVCRVPGGAGC